MSTFTKVVSRSKASPQANLQFSIGQLIKHIANCMRNPER